MALDRRNYRQLVDSTVTIARKTGCSEIVGRIVEDLKDESEPYRRMVMETIDKVSQETVAGCRLLTPIGFTLRRATGQKASLRT